MKVHHCRGGQNRQHTLGGHVATWREILADRSASPNH
jgi:hypothetical protein